MFELFSTGKLNSCLSPMGPCTCRRKLLASTGTMALFAGLTQWVVGYNFSMAALSESLHAFADSSADFFGIAIEKKIHDSPQHEEEDVREGADKVIASLLVLGAILIGIEAYDRWSSGNYPVWLLAVVLVGLFGISIDLLRIRMFSKAREHSDNSNLQGLIGHARSDAQHKGIVTTIAILAMCGVFLGIESGLYNFFVRLSDYLASLGLAGFMMFILAPRIWRGQGCGHDLSKKSSAHTPHEHSHGPGCNHSH